MKSHEAGDTRKRDHAELSADTTNAIRNMARIGLRELADRPHLPNFGIVRPNQYATHGNNIIHSIARTKIAPRNYNAPSIEGLSNVRLEDTFIETDILRFRLFGKTLFRTPDIPTNSSVGVRLRRDFTGQEDNDNLAAWTALDDWEGDETFSMSNRGYAHHLGQFEQRPAVHLAMAALVGQAVNQAQHTDIPLGEATSLYHSWLEMDMDTPLPPSADHIWSIFDLKLY